MEDAYLDLRCRELWPEKQEHQAYHGQVQMASDFTGSSGQR